MNTDFTYCRGADAELCHRCLRWISNHKGMLSKYCWFVEPEYKIRNNTCNNFIKK